MIFKPLTYNAFTYLLRAILPMLITASTPRYPQLAQTIVAINRCPRPAGRLIGPGTAPPPLFVVPIIVPPRTWIPDTVCLSRIFISVGSRSMPLYDSILPTTPNQVLCAPDVLSHVSDLAPGTPPPAATKTRFIRIAFSNSPSRERSYPHRYALTLLHPPIRKELNSHYATPALGEHAPTGAKTYKLAYANL